jgi:hypothetical protein
MAIELAELCWRLPAAHARFAVLRDATAAHLSDDGRAGREAICDFVVLNDVLDEEGRTLAWFDGLDAERRRALPGWAIEFHLVPLLYERERWRDAGELLTEPLEAVETLLDRARAPGSEREGDHGAYERHLILEGEVAQARRVRRHFPGLYRGVTAIYRSLRAAGREAEAAAVREAALRFDDTAAMRAALA